MLRVIDHFDVQQARSMDLERERRKWFIAARERREKKEAVQERNDEQMADLVAAVELASAAEIEAFEIKLDAYDEATVKALMENQKALDAVNLQIQSLLVQAHQLEDGRRVFKTEDGTRVFDENGIEVPPNVVPPEAIPDDRPSWESYQPYLMARERLLQERAELNGYQDRLDEARDAARSGELSQQELEDLDTELADTMPPSVTRHLPEDLRPEADRSVDLKSEYDTVVVPATPAMGNGIQPGMAFTPIN